MTAFRDESALGHAARAWEWGVGYDPLVRASSVSPESAWRVLSRRAHPLWLGGPTRGATYCAADPVACVHIAKGRADVVTGNLFPGLSRTVSDPLVFLDEFLQSVSLPGSGPVPFPGGVVVALNYDTRRFIESANPHDRASSSLAPSPLGIDADIVVALYDTVYAYDHHTQRAWVMATGHTPDGRTDIMRGQERLAEFARLLDHPALAATHADTVDSHLAANMSRDEYIGAVRRALDYISAGDIYQINVSLMLAGDTTLSPIVVSDRLRAVNPSPYHAFFDAGPWQIVSNSPERFITVRGRDIVTSPIKGTRPRGRTIEEDFRHIENLRLSEKELAELRMIVDLERNDIGRISDIGSVRVTNVERVDTYSHVHHLMTDVSGRLREEVGPVDILRAMFPGGSITGCPKIRAMDIIAELEPHRRGFYTGALGFITGDGMDMGLTIRTAVVRSSPKYRGRWDIAVGVGSGIVADSDPDAEYAETLTKAQAFAEALGTTVGD